MHPCVCVRKKKNYKVTQQLNRKKQRIGDI